MKTIDQIDKALLLYLNGMGSPQWDGLWVLLTDKLFWIPLYGLFLLLVVIQYRNFRIILAAVFAITVMVLFVDQSLTLFFKPVIKRLRPCHAPEIMDSIRMVLENCGGRYGFFSAHAANSAALASFGIAALHERYRWFTYILLTYSFLHGYSRIYLAKHYPGDVLTGWLYGALLGYIIFLLFRKFIARWEK